MMRIIAPCSRARARERGVRTTSPSSEPRINPKWQVGHVYTFMTKFYGKEDTRMKKYMAPEMETLTFAAEEAIAGLLGSNLFNDGEFGGW